MRFGVPYLDERYEVSSIVGKTNNSCVYLACHRSLQNFWAIKQVRKNPGRASNDLLAEAHILKKLDHSALPRIVDIYETSRDVYIVEDYILGETYESKLMRGVRFSEKEIRSCFEQLCEALLYLHSVKPKPIIYRDLKPANILLTKEERVKLIDFGIARELSGSSDDASGYGSINYAAPEQYDRYASVDERTDIFGLGATIFHLATGRPIGSYENIPSLREVNPKTTKGLEYIISHCLQLDPEQRYASVKYLLRDLRNIDRFSTEVRRRKLFDFIRVTACFITIAASVFILTQGLTALAEQNQSEYTAIVVEGNKLLQEGKFDQAIEKWSAGIEKAPKLSDAYVATASAYLDVGLYEECIAQIEISYRLNPDLKHSSQMEMIYGLALLDQGEPARAVEHLQTASILNPDNSSIVSPLAVALIQSGRSKEAEALIASISDESAALCVKGEMQMIEKKTDEAIKSYQNALSIAKDPSLRVRIYRSISDAYFLKLKEGEMSDFESCVKNLNALRSEYQNHNIFALERLAQAYYTKAILDPGKQDIASLEKCEDYLNQLLENDYRRAHVYRNIVTVYRKLNKFDDAEQALDAMQERFPNDPDVYLQRAFIHFERTDGRLDENSYNEIVKNLELAKQYKAENSEELRQIQGILSDWEKRSG